MAKAVRTKKAQVPELPVELLRRTIRGVGLRSTAPRIAVLKRLMGAGRPVSHSELHEELALEGMDRTTVYRNLVDLTEAGLVERSDLGDHVWRFELKHRPNGQGENHAHFTCTDCGTVACLESVEVTVGDVKAPKAVGRRKVEVQLRGVCDDCG